MRPPRRSYWAVFGLAALADALAIGGAIWATHVVLPCWWATARPTGWQPGATCERPGWGEALHARLPAIVLVVIALACIGTALVLVIVQVVRARRTLRGFGPRMTPSDAVAQVAAEVGIARLVVVDDPRSTCCVSAEPLWPRVIVSSSVIKVLSTEQLKAVLAHEASYVAHHDPLLITLARAAGAGVILRPRCSSPRLSRTP